MARAPAAVSAPLEFSAERLQAYLRREIPGLEGQMRLERVGGGQSNPTFYVSFDNRALVLRKRPVGANLLPFAHAVDREYRILNALAGSDVPVPKTVLFCASEDLIGTPFYLMERLDGRILTHFSLPEVRREERRAMYFSMAETLARLHGVDWAARGLADYGKPDKNYYARQLVRLKKQWDMTKLEDNPDIDRLMDWLPRHLPPPEETTVIHGDFRFGNLMFHATEPRVIAILDWELSTLGPPLNDIAFSCMHWHTGPDEFGGILGLDLEALGIPTREEYLDHYRLAGGSDRRLTVFHLAYALCRISILFDGIGSRGRDGSAAGKEAAEYGALAPRMARRGVEVLEAAGA